MGDGYSVSTLISSRWLSIVLAGVLMAGGLYSVLWGKNRDQGDCKSMSQDTEECVEEKEKVVSP
ncbi:hypothetical protein QJS10_CPB13g01400 [Acorus calamus]|uniref:Uncharacterized protein n=1 Tax=Acorus calamus TaxID=4465 RepID=A0AAV9DFM2_ACOCL|nr:hypothetical protein QJS10_CPB13g01400 [Acorus calamus]